MNKWIDDKRWSDKFLPEIKRILGEHLISEPPIEEDAERNTDLIVLRLDAIRIACRIRKHKYLASYGNEFTIRCHRASGAKTEITKIIEGWGDYLFYGFCDENEHYLISWKLISLNEFRIWHSRKMLISKSQPGATINNKDELSSFVAFDITKMPAEIIFKQSFA